MTGATCFRVMNGGKTCVEVGSPHVVMCSTCLRAEVVRLQARSPFAFVVAYTDEQGILAFLHHGVTAPDEAAAYRAGEDWLAAAHPDLVARGVVNNTYVLSVGSLGV